MKKIIIILLLVIVAAADLKEGFLSNPSTPQETEIQQLDLEKQNSDKNQEMSETSLNQLPKHVDPPENWNEVKNWWRQKFHERKFIKNLQNKEEQNPHQNTISNKEQSVAPEQDQQVAPPQEQQQQETIPKRQERSKSIKRRSIIEKFNQLESFLKERQQQQKQNNAETVPLEP